MLNNQTLANDTGWTRNPVTGMLSRSVGHWGERQRLFQKRAGGPFYCSVYLADGRRRVRSLGTADHDEALRIVTGQAATTSALDVAGRHAGEEDSGNARSRITLG